MKGTVRFDLDAGRIDSQHFEVDKRVLGFAGPTSSMHYVMQMEERITEAKVAAATPLRQSSPQMNNAAPKTSGPQPASKKEVARRPASSRRPPPRSAHRSTSGKPTQYR